jgi:hypothetical protein
LEERGREKRTTGVGSDGVDRPGGGKREKVDKMLEAICCWLIPDEGAHPVHLGKYWPLLTSSTLVEGGAYFLLSADLFNMLVCLKTVCMMIIWMKDKKSWVSGIEVVNA